MTKSHNRYCPSNPSQHYCRYVSRPIPVTAPPSLNKTLCPSLKTVTALQHPSHPYCRYISRPIPKTAPTSLQKTLCPLVSQPLLPSTKVTPLLPLHKQTNTGNCTALITQNFMHQSHNGYCPSTPVTPLLQLNMQTNTCK